MNLCDELLKIGVTFVRDESTEAWSPFGRELFFEGGSDEDIAGVLSNSLPMMCRTLGDYQVAIMLSGFLVTYRIYREMKA